MKQLRAQYAEAPFSLSLVLAGMIADPRDSRLHRGGPSRVGAAQSYNTRRRENHVLHRRLAAARKPGPPHDHRGALRADVDAGDCTPEQKLPVTWEEQVQVAVDCQNAGATILHIHVRDPKTGHISKNFREYNDQIARCARPCRK